MSINTLHEGDDDDDDDDINPQYFSLPRAIKNQKRRAGKPLRLFVCTRFPCRRVSISPPIPTVNLNVFDRTRCGHSNSPLQSKSYANVSVTGPSEACLSSVCRDWLMATSSAQKTLPTFVITPTTQLRSNYVHTTVECAHSCATAVTLFYTLRWRRSPFWHCTTTRKEVGSIPDGVTEIFHWLRPQAALWP